MDASTRPPQTRRRAALQIACGLVAIFMGITSIYLASISHASTTNTLDAASAEQHFEPAPAAHDVAISTVKSGEEGLELSARFSEDQPQLVTGVSWKIVNESGEKVFADVTERADTALPPGAYQVEASYGTAHILQAVYVHQGTKLSVSFILNAGGLRILPRVDGRVPAETTSHSMVYTLSGPGRGQLVVTSQMPGEILKLPAGQYRIENHFDSGNAVAVVDVTVKPGRMTAVDINHRAGIARLSLGWVVQSSVSWTISDATSRVLFESATPAELVLTPGHYQAVANISGTTYTTSFDLKTGETVDVVMPQK